MSSDEGGRSDGVRAGILVADSKVPQWQADCIQLLQEIAGVELTLLTVQEEAETPHPERHTRPGLLGRYWVEMLGRSPLGRPAVLSQPVRKVARFADLSGRGLTVVLHLSGPRPPPTALEGIPWGLWTFVAGPHGSRTGVPPGLWELCRGEAVTEAALVRLTSSAEGVLLRRAVVKTVARSWPATATSAYRRMRLWPAQACAALRGVLEPARATVQLTVGAVGFPSERQMLGALRTFGRGVGGALWQSLFRHDHWNVGVVNAPIASFLNGESRPAVRWLPAPPRHTFLADPFGIVQGERLTMLCERLDYRSGVGTIAALEPGGPATPVAIGPPVHLSYPYLIRRGDELFCVPETLRAREVALYRAEQFPARWTKVMTLLQDVAAADPTVFQHGGRWWLACADGEGSQNEDLLLWYAPGLEGPWRAHAQNPVKTDVRSARPAGTPFLHEGALYRPAQDCSLRYGGRVVINRVSVLTPDDFDEEPAAVVEPDPMGPCPDGLHTLASVGDRTVIDGNRLAFSALAGASSLRAMLLKHVARRVA